MDINYELYKVFYYVATSLSFSEASKQLFISQSAVSQSIKTLEKKLEQPLFIRNLMYGMFAVTVIATLVGAIAQFGGALKDNPKGAIKSLIGLILLIVLLIVTYNIGSSETVIMGGGTEYTNVTMLKVTDMLLYSTYVLFGLAAIGTLINLSGILKK